MLKIFKTRAAYGLVDKKFHCCEETFYIIFSSTNLGETILFGVFCWFM